MPKRLTLLLFLSALLIPFIINCGKKAPPLPPIIIAPEAPSEARVRQSGNMMIFMFRMPVMNTDQETPADIEKIEIYLLKEPRIGAGEMHKLKPSHKRRLKLSHKPKRKAKPKPIANPNTASTANPNSGFNCPNSNSANANLAEPAPKSNRLKRKVRVRHKHNHR